MIKIAEIVGNSLTGGVTSCVMNYYRNIDRSRFQFDFYTYGPSPIDEEIKELGGNVYYIPSIIKFYSAVPKLIKLLKNKGYDIIHSHMTSLSLFPLYAGKRAKIKGRICHSHSSTYKKEKTKFVKNFLKHFATLYATDYMGCSLLAIDWMYGKKASKAVLLPNAIDLEKFSPNDELRNNARAEYGLENNFVVGHIGRFEYQKNHEFLMDIFAEVKKEVLNAKLVLCGIGSLKGKVLDQIKYLGLEDDVLILPEIKEVEKYYAMFDVFVLPSRYEGLPLVAVEAQAMDVKCLLSCQISPETSFSTNCEFLSIDDKSEWVKRLVELSKYPEKSNARDELSRRGYDIKQSVKNLENAYQEIANRNN